MKYFILTVCAVFQLTVGFSQADKTFWFAVPDVTDLHQDRPIQLNFTTLDKLAEVTIDIPAQKFEPLVLSIPAFTYFTYDITKYITQLENRTSETVLPNGLLITSTEYINVNYEVVGTNTDIFVLKGKKSLGTLFYTPFQSKFPNKEFNYNGTVLLKAYSSFDIVATENNTKVTITLGGNSFSHSKGDVIEITLNKGETYAVISPEVNEQNRLNGSVIQANKPIAVTKKDDSVYKGANWDLIGDQLVPVTEWANHYVAQLGWAHIISSENNNQITFGDSVFTLQKNQFAFIEVDEITYVHSEKPMSVFQFVEINNELGGAFLPGLSCTGSRRVSFYRNNETNFDAFLLTKTNAIDQFYINDKLLDTLTFYPIAGTELSYANMKEMFSKNLSKNTNYTIENKKAAFHLGVKQGGSASGAQYGYYSDYGFADLGLDQVVCFASEFEITAAYGMDSYLWSTGETGPSIMVNQDGLYKLTVTKDTCSFSDSINIVFSPHFNFEFPADTFGCEKTPVLFSIENNPDWTYSWSNGSTTNQAEFVAPSVASLTVTNSFGCVKKDSAQLKTILYPYSRLGNDTTICENRTFRAGEKNNTTFKYVWQDGSQSHYFDINNAGTYYVDISTKCGAIRDSITTIFWNLEFPNVITPNFDGKNETLVLKNTNEGIWLLDVYNRWGSLVYHNEDYNDTFAGEELSTGTYYYSAKEKNTNCTERKSWLLIEK